MNENLMFYLIAYLVGSIPFGLILAKAFAKKNILEEGSCSIGATNVLRVVGAVDKSLAKKLAFFTVILDAFKGLAVLLVASYVFDMSVNTLWAIAVLSVVGHCFSLYLWFEGGKGVATALGVCVFMLPLEVAVGVLFWIISVKVFKISSVSSLVGMVAFAVSSFIIHPQLPVINTHAPVLFILFFVTYQHIPNIIRLFKKEESSIV